MILLQQFDKTIKGQDKNIIGISNRKQYTKTQF